MLVMEEPQIINGIYQLDQLIRKTANGCVYYGFHIRLKKEILICVSQAPLLFTEVDVDRLPYLPYVIDRLQNDGRYYTIFNYIRGVFLDDIIQENREITEYELISIGIQICEILKDFGKRSILAKEIWNMDNVMVTPDFHISFLDGSTLIHMDRKKDVSDENLKAALAFLRILCQSRKINFSRIINREYKNISKLKRDLLKFLKQMPAYRKLKWKQKFLYVGLLGAFGGSIVLLQRSALLYREDTLMNAGDWDFSNSHYAEAVVEYQSVLQLNPENIVARRKLAEAYWNEGNVVKAEQYFLENAECFQDKAATVYLFQIQESKALEALRQGNYSEALAYYLDLEMKNPSMKYEEMLFHIYRRQNDFENMKSMIQKLQSQEINIELRELTEEMALMINRNEEAEMQLCELADLIIQNDWLTLSDRLQTKEYREWCQTYGGAYSRFDENFFVKLYKNGAIYLGEMDGNQRCGNGKLVLLGTECHNLIIFTGKWKDDMPNGVGTQSAVIVPYLRNGRQIWLSINGNYINGYSNGELFVKEYEVIGTEEKIFRSISYKSNMGYLEEMGAENRDNIIGIWSDGEIQYSPHYNHIESVAGLGLSDCNFYFDKEVD